MNVLRRNRSRGAAILSMLLCLVIIFILMGMFLGPVSTGPGAPRGAKPWAFQQLDRTKLVVCEANRRTMLTTQFSDEITYGRSRTDKPEDMVQTAQKFSPCPGTGKLYLCEGEINCTQHIVTQRFRERLDLL